MHIQYSALHAAHLYLPGTLQNEPERSSAVDIPECERQIDASKGCHKKNRNIPAGTRLPASPWQCAATRWNHVCSCFADQSCLTNQPRERPSGNAHFLSCTTHALLETFMRGTRTFESRCMLRTTERQRSLLSRLLRPGPPQSVLKEQVLDLLRSATDSSTGSCGWAGECLLDLLFFRSETARGQSPLK
jgi:hypothetical protein